MSNGLAIWGAVTGTIGTLTGLGSLVRTALRDRKESHRELEVTHGWQYAYRNNELLDVWVCVTLFNRGRKPLHAQYVGFETMVIGDRTLARDAGVELPKENNVWVNHRFEIALNSEVLEIAPDGPPVRVWTRLVPICRYAIDPTTTPFRAYAVTYNEVYWWENNPQPLLPEPSQVHRTPGAIGEAVATLVLDEMGDEGMKPPTDLVGGVVGLQRLILDGDVLHVRDVLGDSRPADD